MKCKICGRETTPDETGLYKKLVSRGATDSMCITCLAAHFKCGEELLKEKIKQFKKQGCRLFCANP